MCSRTTAQVCLIQRDHCVGQKCLFRMRVRFQLVCPNWCLIHFVCPSPQLLSTLVLSCLFTFGRRCHLCLLQSCPFSSSNVTSFINNSYHVAQSDTILFQAVMACVCWAMDVAFMALFNVPLRLLLSMSGFRPCLCSVAAVQKPSFSWLLKNTVGWTNGIVVVPFWHGNYFPHWLGPKTI